jgi:hypothetical protein
MRPFRVRNAHPTQIGPQFLAGDGAVGGALNCKACAGSRSAHTRRQLRHGHRVQPGILRQLRSGAPRRPIKIGSNVHSRSS